MSLPKRAYTHVTTCNGFGQTVCFFLAGQPFGLVCYHIHLVALCLAFELLFKLAAQSSFMQYMHAAV